MEIVTSTPRDLPRSRSRRARCTTRSAWTRCAQDEAGEREGARSGRRSAEAPDLVEGSERGHRPRLRLPRAGYVYGNCWIWSGREDLNLRPAETYCRQGATKKRPPDSRPMAARSAWSRLRQQNADRVERNRVGLRHDPGRGAETGRDGGDVGAGDRLLRLEDVRVAQQEP